MRILLAILLASSTPAIAETCTVFGDTTFAELDAKQQARFVGGAGWATVTGITWKTVKATIQIERAPRGCPRSGLWCCTTIVTRSDGTLDRTA